jgi:phospholipid-binding lipoprotein MlaA
MFICLAALFLAACAGNIPAAPKDQRAATDPWEPLNRRVSNFNDGLDKVTFKPLAKGYEAIVPRFARQGVGNFSRNLLGPMNMINNLLQGKPKHSGVELGRFLINSTMGLGGLVDIATDSGIPAYAEPFGETFAVWGIPDGPYVVIPLLGPRTLSGVFAIPLNFLADPLFHVDDSTLRWSVYGLRAVDLRQRLFAAEALTKDSFDRYLTIRESFLQNRRFRIYDGEPPEDEDFYDEFLEEDEEE